MHRLKRTMVYALLLIVAYFAAAKDSWGQNEITFAGVTHMVDANGAHTNLGLGINVYPADVTSACVQDPDNITVYCYTPENFREEGSDLYYWITLPGPPKQGTYTFTVEFTDGIVDTATDVQGALETLPIINASDVTIDGNHTGTPAFSWPDVAHGDYYRVVLFDESWNTIYRSGRSTATNVTIPAGTLPAGINYQAHVEVHDSDSFATLNNRADGEYLYLDTICLLNIPIPISYLAKFS